MRTLLKNLFIKNWPRKCLAIVLGIIIWFVVSKSLTSTKTITNVPVRIENIPPGKTISDIQPNGILNKRINLTLSGNKTLLDDLTANDIEVVFDASNKQGEWIATITKRNIRSDNPDINISQGISAVSTQNFLVKLTKLMTEKIPIIITQPIGESPKGYQYLDIWPYQLYITVSGPQEMIKKLKSRGLKLTFNLNDISKSQLDDLSSNSTQDHFDVVSYFVPNHLKQISLPLLSPTPIEINDPDAKFLRIDFLRYELLKIDNPIPVSFFFPPNQIGHLNPQKIELIPNKVIENRGGFKVIPPPLYVKGVSSFFLEMIKDMIQLVILVTPKENGECLDWSIQFINPKILEDRYVHILMSDVNDEEIYDLQPRVREEYLRNRFRSYMNRFELFHSNNQKFKICPQLEGTSIKIEKKQEQ